MPRAWGRVARAELDVRPGGIFSIDIAVGDGPEIPNLGCFLDVVPMQRGGLHDGQGVGVPPGDGDRGGSVRGVRARAQVAPGGADATRPIPDGRSPP